MIGYVRDVLGLAGYMVFVVLMGVLALFGLMVAVAGCAALWFEVWKLFQ